MMAPSGWRNVGWCRSHHRCRRRDGGRGSDGTDAILTDAAIGDEWRGRRHLRQKYRMRRGGADARVHAVRKRGKANSGQNRARVRRRRWRVMLLLVQLRRRRRLLLLLWLLLALLRMMMMMLLMLMVIDTFKRTLTRRRGRQGSRLSDDLIAVFWRGGNHTRRGQ